MAAVRKVGLSVCPVAKGIEQLQFGKRIMNIPEMIYETLLES